MTAIVSLYESFALELVGGNVAGVVLCDALPDVGTLAVAARLDGTGHALWRGHDLCLGLGHRGSRWAVPA